MPDPVRFCDASHWQGVIDAHALKAAGVVGVVHKATEIMRYSTPVDEMYEANKARCLDAGLLFGAYLFLNPTSGAAQADFYLDTVKPDGKTLLAIDVEDKGLTLAHVEDCVLRIQERTGVCPWLYTSIWVLNRIPGAFKSAVLRSCMLWLAGKPPTLPPPWTEYSIWQGSYIWIGGSVFDLNYYYGSQDELVRVWQLTSPTNITGVVDAKLVASNRIDVYQGAGYSFPVVRQLHAGDGVVVNRDTAKADDTGVVFYQTPVDDWISSENLQFAATTPLPVVRYAAAVLNIRETPVVTAKLLGQVKYGAKVEVFAPALTTANHYIQLATVDGKPVSGWVTNDSLSVNSPNL